jgi:flagellar basal-body rod protein FlgC
MSPIASIAASGMLAAMQRLQVSADNVVNANSDGPLPSAPAAVQAQYPAAYTPQQVDQVETAGGGTAAIVSSVDPGTVATFDPEAPYADANGLVASPNVDYANEAILQVTASYEFAFNALVMRVYSQIIKSGLDIQA